MQIAKSIATYIIPSDMSVVGTSVQSPKLDTMSLLTSNNSGGNTTYPERSAMPTPRQPMPNFLRAMYTKDSIYFDIFPAS